MVTMRADMRDFDRLTRELVSYARITALAIAFRAAKEQILANASKGLRADKSSMGKYSTAHAKKREAKGLQTEHIDFRFAGNLLNSIQLMNGHTLTVAAEMQDMAEGLTRMKGEWMAANEDTVGIIERTLAAGIEKSVR